MMLIHWCIQAFHADISARASERNFVQCVLAVLTLVIEKRIVNKPITRRIEPMRTRVTTFIFLSMLANSFSQISFLKKAVALA